MGVAFRTPPFSPWRGETGMAEALGTGVDPLGRAVGPVFFFPDRHDDFERVDQEAAGFEGVVAVRGADGDGDADVAELEMPQPVHDCDVHDRPALARLLL